MARSSGDLQPLQPRPAWADQLDTLDDITTLDSIQPDAVPTQADSGPSAAAFSKGSLPRRAATPATSGLSSPPVKAMPAQAQPAATQAQPIPVQPEAKTPPSCRHNSLSLPSLPQTPHLLLRDSQAPDMFSQ